MGVEFLRGTRVLDIGRLMPSSIAAFELGKLGADVVKVEFPPNGDYLRINEPLIGGRGDMHLDINRNKRSVCLDPRRDEGQKVLAALIESADVIIVAARPSSLGSLGLDYERCAALNPRLVHCAISGYGEDGPYSALAAHGLSSDAAAGLIPVEDDGQGNRVVSPSYISVGPRAAGLHASLSIVAALYGRDTRTGVGEHIEISQWGSAVWWNYRDLDQFSNTGERIPTYQNLGYRYAIYQTSDDREVLLAAPEPTIWRKFCESIGRSDLAEGAGDGVIEYVDDPHGREELRAIFRTRSQADWIQLASSDGIPISPLVTLEDLPADPHIQHRGMLAPNPHPLGGEVLLTGHPVQFAGGSVAWTPAPELGEHSRQVLHDLDIAESQIDALVDSGVIIQHVGNAGDGST